MKKNVLINIRGVQHYDDDKEVVELMTIGKFYRRGSSYYISYDESEATGFEGKTTLKVEDDGIVTMLRSGASKSQLIIEQGTRHQCQYETGFGNLIMGVSGNRVSSSLSESGGDLSFKYTLDFNASMASENEVFINVKEQKQAEGNI